MIKIIPLASGTRLRGDHNTFSNVINSFGQNDVLQGEEIWTAPMNGNEVTMGDQWLHVTSANGVPTFGWMAIIHKGQSISQIVADVPPVEPPVKLQNMRLVDLDTNEFWDWVRKPNA